MTHGGFLMEPPFLFAHFPPLVKQPARHMRLMCDVPARQNAAPDQQRACMYALHAATAVYHDPTFRSPA
ncbi:hypothetical protein FHY18_001544 [Xanthomonas arboricola]|nr:hypothetical protein [Xanthomonas sp. 3793]